MRTRAWDSERTFLGVRPIKELSGVVSIYLMRTTHFAVPITVRTRVVVVILIDTTALGTISQSLITANVAVNLIVAIRAVVGAPTVCIYLAATTETSCLTIRHVISYFVEGPRERLTDHRSGTQLEPRHGIMSGRLERAWLGVGTPVDVPGALGI